MIDSPSRHRSRCTRTMTRTFCECAHSGAGRYSTLSLEGRRRKCWRPFGRRPAGTIFQESVGLPDENPDVDLIIADDTSSTVVLAELKWIRKPLRALEIPDRDADVMKGIDQLQLIRTFLRANPRHLRDQRRLSRPLTDYERVHYLLVARDHWRWVDPGDQIASVQFDAFARILARSNDLRAAMDELLRYDWLPIEGANFAVRFERAAVNGVSIESEVFYSI